MFEYERTKGRPALLVFFGETAHDNVEGLENSIQSLWFFLLSGGRRGRRGPRRARLPRSARSKSLVIDGLLGTEDGLGSCGGDSARQN